MNPPPDEARVLDVASAATPPADGIVLAGRLIEIAQPHLLEPFADLLASIEALASVAAQGRPAGPNEEAAVRAIYRSLYRFFHTLLPSASHPAIDGLTYSVALLLVGEAIEAVRNVVTPPKAASRENKETACGKGSISSSFRLHPSSLPTGRSV
jgi:hypothetical protein